MAAGTGSAGSTLADARDVLTKLEENIRSLRAGLSELEDHLAHRRATPGIVLRTAQRWILTTSREVAATFVTILLRLVDSTSDLEHGVVVVSSEDEI